MKRSSKTTMEKVKKMLSDNVPDIQIINETGVSKRTIDNIRYRTKSKSKAEQMIENGKGPLSVHVATGMDLSKARALHEKHKAAHPDPSSLIPAKSEAATPPANPVTTRMMTQEEIDKYGPPKAARIDNITKDFVLKIGPVGVDAAAEVVKSTIES
jgi:hypothetical protein